MIKKNLVYIVLTFIILFGFILRFWNVSNNPTGLTWDEAALGYNAYSIIKTGRDEYGSFMPLILKSFGDYKPAVYTYLDIPFVFILGLNELAVRLPSVLFGTLFIFLLFYFINQVSSNKLIALSCAFFAAISPLAIQFSRPGFEANVAMTLNLLAVIFFIKGIKKSKWFFLSSVAFGISLFTYQASRLFVPLLIFVLIVVFRKNLKVNKQTIISAIFLGLILLISAYIVLGAGGNRLSAMNYFAYKRSDDTVNQLAQDFGTKVSDPKFQIIYGEWFAYTKGLFERYLIYFSPQMLFVSGDPNQRDRVPDLGVLSYISLIFVSIGFVYLWKLKDPENKKYLNFIFICLFISPIPAVLSRDLISMIRALNMVVPLTILEGAGFYWLIKNLAKYRKIYFYPMLLIIGGLVAINFIIFLDRYFIHEPYEYAEYWLSSYKPVVLATSSIMKSKTYDHIIFSDYYGQPYMFYLFYTLYPPEKYQPQAILDQPTVDVGTVRRIDNIEFRHIYLPDDRSLHNTLLIGTVDELPDSDLKNAKDLTLLQTFTIPNGKTTFKIVETK